MPLTATTEYRRHELLLTTKYWPRPPLEEPKGDKTRQVRKKHGLLCDQKVDVAFKAVPDVASHSARKALEVVAQWP